MDNTLSTHLVAGNAPQLLSAVKEYGSMIAKSGMFGCKNESQGQTLVMMAMSEGLPISEFRKRYHIVGNDISMRADFMRAEFRRLGGEYRWVKDGDDGKEAVMHIKYRENEMDVRYTIEDAKREGLIKPGSRWEKAPGDMLRARVSTKAIRMVCSEVLAGFATDEELMTESDHDGVPPSAGDNIRASSPPAEASPAKHDDAVIDVEFEVTPHQDDPNLASGPQLQRLRELIATLKVPADKQLAAFKKRGAESLASLSRDGAADLITTLEKLLADAMAKTAGQSKADPAAMEEPSDGPASQAQINKAMSLLSSLIKVPGYADAGVKVKEKLVSHGLKLADLSRVEIDQLIDSLGTQNLKAFFDSTLKGWPAGE